ncbi:hypothetical protein LCGC14_2263280, partial [marine sediment metagenome]
MVRAPLDSAETAFFQVLSGHGKTAELEDGDK